MAIQLIINRELGLNLCENPWQGSFIIDELTDLVEAAVYDEFDRISERGGVLGAMDTMYQRGKIQDESLYYERLKHTGELPLIGVNTFLPKEGRGERIDKLELMRSTDAEKRAQIETCGPSRPGGRPSAGGAEAATGRRAERGNVFEALMDAVKVASLGQISAALYEVGASTGATCRMEAARLRRETGGTRARAPMRGSSAWSRASPSSSATWAWPISSSGAPASASTLGDRPAHSEGGRTKDVKLDRVRELEPTHVIVNVEENRRETAEALAEFVPHMVVTHPQEPRDNLELYRLLGAIFDREAEAERLCADSRRRSQSSTSRRWPRAGRALSDLARSVDGRRAGDLHRPDARAAWAGAPSRRRRERYPEVDLRAYAGRVDRVLLSSEPFHFKERHIAEVEALVPGAQVTLIDGEMTSWYGSRAIKGMRYLAEYR